MTGTVIEATVRRAACLAGTTAVLVAAGALLAGPASAEVAEGWGPDTSVDKLYVLGVMVGVPILLFVLIIAMVYLPSLARGERVAPGATGPEDQWLGGRRSAGELTSAGSGADDADGGASARW